MYVQYVCTTWTIVPGMYCSTAVIKLLQHSSRCDLVIGCYAAYPSTPLVVAAKVYFWLIGKGLCAKTSTALGLYSERRCTKTVGGRHTTFTCTLFSVWSVVVYTQWKVVGHSFVEQHILFPIFVQFWSSNLIVPYCHRTPNISDLWRGLVWSKNYSCLWAMLKMVKAYA